MSGDLGYNVMFVGTSFMGIYNVGSAQCLQDHGKGVIHQLQCVGGTSAGAITACLMVCAPERLLEYKDAIYQLSTQIHDQDKGACTVGYDIIGHIRRILDRYLNTDAHVICSGRICIPLTELVPVTSEFSRITQNVAKAYTKQTENVSPRSPRGTPATVEMGGKTWTFGNRAVVSKFNSREELIEVLLASTYVPWFTDWTPPVYANRGARQKPKDNLTTEWRDVSNESFQLQPFNMFRVGSALYPPPVAQLKQFFTDGVEDARDFLQRFKIYQPGIGSLRGEGPIN